MAAGDDHGGGKSREGVEPRADGACVVREPTRRLFFALWPDETLRATFAHATHKAVRACGGRPVPTHNLHVTLLFLGSVAERRTPELEAIGARVAAAGTSHAGAAPLPQLAFDRVEHWEKARILVATVSAQSTTGATTTPGLASMGGLHSGLAAAEALASGLLREAHRAGFTADLKPFRAHVTVARKVARLTHSLHMREVLWAVTGFALVESRTEPQGAVYNVLKSYPLHNAAARVK